MSISWEEAVLWLREQPDARDLVRQCFYDDPILEAAQRYYHSSEWNSIRHWLPRQKGRALDLGAGRGISCYALAREGWKTVALEPDPSQIVGTGAIRALFQASGLPIEIRQEWGESLPFEANTFQLVHARAVLHHARNLKHFCMEAARVLERGGLFLAIREHVLSRPGDLKAFLESHPLHRLYGGEHAYLLDEYLEAMRRAGIRLIQVLNPYQSDINLFPATRQTLKSYLAAKIRLPWPSLIPDAALTWWANRSNTPGRLYSFIGIKE